MKPEATPKNIAIVAGLITALLAAGFWMQILSPQREEVAKLEREKVAVAASLAQHEAEIAAGEAARDSFPADYRQLVVLGKAVPGDDDFASLLVQVDQISHAADVRFSDLQMSGGGGGEAAAAAAPVEGATPTEAAASLLPLGATVGPAGLAVMPYTLTFEGTFFQIADFIQGLDSMVKSGNEKVTVDGRLLTINSFQLSPQGDDKGASLSATFEVTSYLTPPGSTPAPDEAESATGSSEVAPVSTTTGAVR